MTDNIAMYGIPYHLKTVVVFHVDNDFFFIEKEVKDFLRLYSQHPLKITEGEARIIQKKPLPPYRCINLRALTTFLNRRTRGDEVRYWTESAREWLHTTAIPFLEEKKKCD